MFTIVHVILVPVVLLLLSSSSSLIHIQLILLVSLSPPFHDGDHLEEDNKDGGNKQGDKRRKKVMGM